ncbi:N amino acid transport system protein-like protein [Paramyrothecium foliicola]|nr:N amino acid transport system protein-like protein [Paramyrothecium foliicola]
MTQSEISESSRMDVEAASNKKQTTGEKESAIAPGETHEGALIDYKTLTWWQGGIVLIAETVSLGILSLPSVVATLGLVPGIVLILVMAVLSTYSGLMLHEFWKKYPFVQNFGDALEIIGKPHGLGRLFQELFGWAQVIFQVFVAGGHILSWTICMNTLTDSSTCTIVWAVVGLGVFWVLNLPRTLKYTSWMSFASCLSIILATLMTVGDVGVNRPIGDGVIEIARELKFTVGFLAVTNISIAFSSHSCFFSVINEFKNPDDFPKALALLQITDTALYLVAAVVTYVYVGADVPSPALSASNSITMRKAIWGVAIPTIVIAGVIYGHVAARYIFTRIFRDTKHMVRRTKTSNIAWFAITFCIWLLSMVIAESIPIFNSLLGLIASLFVSWFSYGLPGLFWLWMHWGNLFSDWKQTTRCVANISLLLTGFLICVLGSWASIESLVEDEFTKPWTCASNAA